MGLHKLISDNKLVQQYYPISNNALDESDNSDNENENENDNNNNNNNNNNKNSGNGNGNGNNGDDTGVVGDKSVQEETTQLLFWYLKNSFGNPVRLDYGSGHELFFMIYLYVLLSFTNKEKGQCNHEYTLNTDPAFTSTSTSTSTSSGTGMDVSLINGSGFVKILFAYYKIITKLITKFNLEPAGSHGVWGLDDYFFLVYYFGAAQLISPFKSRSRSRSTTTTTTTNTTTNTTTTTTTSTAQLVSNKDVSIRPHAVINKDVATSNAHHNLYCFAIAFIYRTKSGGPFFEHSSRLYDISTGVASWSKINIGLLRMYIDEVLIYQCKNARLLNNCVNCSKKRANSPWIAVLFPVNVPLTVELIGGTSHTAICVEFGIHSIKFEPCLSWYIRTVSSASETITSPRRMADAVRYLPCRGSAATIMFFASNICRHRSLVVTLRYIPIPSTVCVSGSNGAYPVMKKCRRGNGTRFTPSLRRSEFSCPGNRSVVVIPDIT
ncbi:Serine/threonine-protein phosphatase 2A activator 1 [Zancudomyces culisetae]|uniref:Serine/threonine-protein phosphatase 2A activator n=1 Tax=Zancudomyces culisetae TaxID=1213189 RepID=A0A1R1PQ56_ZANCU|nr:Serine/threonine-protein phosphatase 2A activator 1 [Zancudomyces culisetae]|eukprot:OMH83126.1 Serine/threonine-protein phosphatase 2A activator 1 [Zancudomyces culisetae]